MLKNKSILQELLVTKQFLYGKQKFGIVAHMTKDIIGWMSEIHGNFQISSPEKKNSCLICFQKSSSYYEENLLFFLYLNKVRRGFKIFSN